MKAPRVLASTTSHKAEPLLQTLEVFARLGLCDIDLNLHHILEVGVPIDAIQQEVAARDLHIWGLAGGWCDFFEEPPNIDATFQSVDRQVRIAEAFGVTLLRLFFGRLKLEHYSDARRDALCANLLRLSDRHPRMRFNFENHDGASLRPEICADVLQRVHRPNIRMNFDPINFEKYAVSSLDAIRLLAPYVGHVHLKGLEDGEFCEFGVGDVDLAPVLDVLLASGYAGSFSVEYEGPFDKTLRLFESVKRARHALAIFN